MRRFLTIFLTISFFFLHNITQNSPGKYPADKVEHVIQETFKFINFDNIEVLGSVDDQIARKTQLANDIITAQGW